MEDKKRGSGGVGIDTHNDGVSIDTHNDEE